MSTWSAERAAALVAAAVLAVAGGALAQAPGEDVGGAAAQPSAGASEAAPSRADEIVAAPLADVDPFVIGALTAEGGGLPDTLWSGSDLAGITEAMRRAPAESGFLAVSEMTARVLLSGGASPAPPGDRRDAAVERLAALLGLGQVNGVDDIVSTTPRGLADPELAVLAVQARLAMNEIASACRVGDELREGRNGAFWLRLRTACFAWAGETAAIELTLDLAREADESVADDAFTAWVFAAASGKAPDRAPAPRDALESALAQSTDYVFDAEVLERLPLLVAVGLLRDQDVTPDVRALAARRAARVGAVSADALAAALEQIPAPADVSSVSQLIAAAADEGFPAAHALLVRAASAKTATPFEAAMAIDLLLARAETPADFIVTARALSDVMATLPPSPDLATFAPRLVLAAAAVGDRGLAYAWLNPQAPGLAASSPLGAGWAREGFTPILNTKPDFSRSPVEPVARIAAEAVVAAADFTASPERLSSVALARLESAAAAGEAEQAAARRDALILVALGAEVSPELRRAASIAAEEAHVASDTAPQALAAAQLAAEAGALGETALYLAQAAADAGPSHAPTIARAIEIAKAAGLETEAHALAVEAMLAARIGAASRE
jgi:hypothetical protein